MGAEEWNSHNTQQTFREVAEYNQQMATRQASVMDLRCAEIGIENIG